MSSPSRFFLLVAVLLANRGKSATAHRQQQRQQQRRSLLRTRTRDLQVSSAVDNVVLAAATPILPAVEELRQEQDQQQEEDQQQQQLPEQDLQIEQSESESGMADGSTIVAQLLRSWHPQVTEQRPEWHGDTTAVYDEDGDIRIRIPTISAATTSDISNDLLFLFVSRTDNPLPLEMDGWTRAAECFKSRNEQSRCWLASDCMERSTSYGGRYCDSFPNGGTNGRDLATVVFYRPASDLNSDSSGYYSFSLRGTNPGWAIMTVIRGVDVTNPVRDFSTQSCDSDRHSIFPSVENGRAGDILLLSMAFDDTAESDVFEHPDGTEFLGFTNGKDEAGYLYGTRLTANGPTGDFVTGGPGASRCKDALIAMTLRPASGSSTPPVSNIDTVVTTPVDGDVPIGLDNPTSSEGL